MIGMQYSKHTKKLANLEFPFNPNVSIDHWTMVFPSTLTRGLGTSYPASTSLNAFPAIGITMLN